MPWAASFESPPFRYTGDGAPQNSGEPSDFRHAFVEKLNELKGFRHPPQLTTGSPLGGLAAVNASHIWLSAIESE
jgi:hypothetical protein